MSTRNCIKNTVLKINFLYFGVNNMDFKEWLRSNGITEVGKFYDPDYENLDNIIGKQFWICDYRLNKDRDSKMNLEG